MTMVSGDQFYGRGFDHLFPEGSAPITTVPFPRASRRKNQSPWEEGKVHEALRQPPQPVEVDPRTLHASQPMVTSEGVKHYMSGEYERTGRTFADQHVAGNRMPVVYERENTQGVKTNVILSGHHRAAAALVQGKNLRAIVVKGGWGAKR